MFLLRKLDLGILLASSFLETGNSKKGFKTLSCQPSWHVLDFFNANLSNKSQSDVKTVLNRFNSQKVDDKTLIF